MLKTKPKIIFFGTPRFSEIILDSLINNHFDIIGIFTKPDQKVSRQQEWQKTPVKILAEKNGIPVFEPVKLDIAAIEQIKKLSPDIIVVAAYGKIIPQEILDIPKFGSLNVHPSLLPEFRGSSPIQNVLLAGKKETGTTIMLMDAGVDTGDILNQKKIPINESEKLPELSEKLARLSAKLLLETIPSWIAGKINPQKQNNDKATSCRLIKKEDGQINWREDAKSIYNRFRAFYPWPGISTNWNGKKIKLIKISLLENNTEKKYQTGEVFKHNSLVAIQTSKGFVVLKDLQIEGKPITKSINFINGYRNFIGSILC